MIFPLGILAMLQMTVLPGWLWMRGGSVRTTNRYEEALYCFAASLINHWLVYVLATVRLHNQVAWLTVIAVETGFLLFLGGRSGGSPTLQPRFIPAKPAPAIAKSRSVTSLCIFSFAVVTLLAFVPILYENWGTVFASNDDVASWDRWARDWFLNRWPIGPGFYPQLLPANWSITYALLGTDQVKLFAKAIMPLFALGVPLLFWALALKEKTRVFLIGCSISGFLLLQYLGRDVLMTGYADVACAFFSFLAFYALYKQGSATQAPYLAVLFATGAATAKQAGLCTLAAVVLFLAITRRKNAAELHAGAALRWSAALAAGFVALWYTPVVYRALAGIDATNFRYLMHDIHANRSYAERLWHGCNLLIAAGGQPGLFFLILLSALVLGGIFFRETRMLTLGIVLPSLLVWSMFFSYEVRTSAIALPFVAFVSGLTVSIILDYARALALKKLRASRIFIRGTRAYAATGALLFSCGALLYYSGDLVPRIRIDYSWPTILVGLFVAIAPVIRVTRRLRWEGSAPAAAVSLAALFCIVAWGKYSDTNLLQQQLSAQRLIGNPPVNDRLYRLHEAGQLNAPVLANYWYLNALPDLHHLNRTWGCEPACSLPRFLRTVADVPDAQFLLLDEQQLPSITVRSLPYCAGMKTIFVEGTVRLLRVDHSKLRIDDPCTVDPEMIRPEIQKLHPAGTAPGVGFNLQGDGSAALGVACRNATRTSVIVWNGTRLDTAYGGPGALTATVPGELFAKPGRYPIEVFDPDAGLRSKPRDFEVK